MNYKPTMRLVGPEDPQRHIKGFHTDSDTMIGQDATRAGQSFLKRRWKTSLTLTVHMCLFLVYAGGFIYAVQDMIRHRHEAGLVHSPARGAVEYEVRTVDDSSPVAFASPPSEKTDAAWQVLLRYNNLVVQEEDLIKIDKSSVPLRDGSGYLSGLGVMHQLHCLNHIREYAFPDYYIQETGRDKEVHVYHCIDNLRHIIMCHADITPRTYEWTENSPYPAMTPTSKRECRKWEPLYTFAKGNQPSRTHGAILENPTLGVIESSHLNASQAE